MRILKLGRKKLSFDLKLNSHNYFAGKCVAARGENSQSDLKGLTAFCSMT